MEEQDCFAAQNAVLIPEILHLIIHFKYTTFQLTNCWTLEISPCPWQVTSISISVSISISKDSFTCVREKHRHEQQRRHLIFKRTK